MGKYKELENGWLKYFHFNFWTITTIHCRLDNGEDQRVDKSEFTDEKMKPIIEKVKVENIKIKALLKTIVSSVSPFNDNRSTNVVTYKMEH